MRKTKWIILVALCLCTVMLFASCASDSNAVAFKKVFDSGKTAPEQNPVTMTEVEISGQYQDAKEELVYFAELEENRLASQTVFNMQLDKIVYSNVSEEDLEVDVYVSSTAGYSYFVERITDTRNADAPAVNKTILYRADGEKIAEVQKAANVVSSFDLVRIDSRVYRLTKDGNTYGASEVTGYSALQALPTIDYAVASYYYDFNTNNSGADRVTVYDKDCNIVGTYMFEARTSAYGVLDNGNILVQYTIQQPADAKKYTYYNGVNKYNLKTVLVNPKKCTAKEIKFNYVLSSVYTVDREAGYVAFDQNDLLSKKVKNVAVVYPIEDSRALTGSNYAMLLLLSSSAKVKGNLSMMFDGQSPASFPRLVKEGYFTVQLINGSNLLVNKEGKVIGNAGNSAVFTAEYVYANGKIYNYALEELYDYEAEDYSLNTRMQFSSIFVKDDDNGNREYYRFNGTGMTKIDAADDDLSIMTFAAGADYYALSDTSDADAPTLTYYNAKGEKILESEDNVPLNPICTYGQARLFSGKNAETDTFIYYFFAG